MTTKGEPDDILLAEAEAVRGGCGPVDAQRITDARASVQAGTPLTEQERFHLARISIRAEFSRPRGSHTRALPGHKQSETRTQKRADHKDVAAMQKRVASLRAWLKTTTPINGRHFLGKILSQVMDAHFLTDKQWAVCERIARDNSLPV